MLLLLAGACTGPHPDAEPRLQNDTLAAPSDRRAQASTREHAWALAPPLDMEQGACWVRLRRLSQAQVQAVRSEFMRRNPGWELHPMHIDPFTALVTHADYLRTREENGTAAEPSRQEYERRRLEPLQRNADLVGISEREVAILKWDRPAFGSASRFGTTPHATAMRADPRLAALGVLRGEWSVTVNFARDGVVNGFTVRQSGPPVPICAVPAVTAAQARVARGLTDAAFQPERLGYFNSGFTAAPNEIGGAHLDIDQFIDGSSSSDAKSVIWRLVWAVDVRNGDWTFLVDAMSGQVTGLRRNFIE